MFVRKTLDKLDRVNDRHSLNTRNKHKLVISCFRLSRTNKSFLGKVVSFINNIFMHIYQSIS